MTNQKHTAEPWRMRTAYEPNCDTTTIEVSNWTGKRVLVIRFPEHVYSEQETDKANAARIVACVNLLAGIPTEQFNDVKELLTNWPDALRASRALAGIENPAAVAGVISACALALKRLNCALSALPERRQMSVRQQLASNDIERAIEILEKALAALSNKSEGGGK